MDTKLLCFMSTNQVTINFIESYIFGIVNFVQRNIIVTHIRNKKINMTYIELQKIIKKGDICDIDYHRLSNGVAGKSRYGVEFCGYTFCHWQNKHIFFGSDCEECHGKMIFRDGGEHFHQCFSFHYIETPVVIVQPKNIIILDEELFDIE